MPLFSRRKSEANLQAADVRASRSANRSRGEKEEAVRLQGGRTGRSRSSTRETTGGTRPDRVPPPLPSKERFYNTGMEVWELENKSSTGAIARHSSSTLPPGAMAARPPSAQFHFTTPSASSPSSSAPYPRRQSSLGASSASHDLSFTSPAASSTSVVSPRFYQTSPNQTSDSTQSSLKWNPNSIPLSPLASFDNSPGSPPSSSSKVEDNTRYFYTPPPKSTRKSSANPPISSSAKFARSISSADSPGGGGFDYSRVGDNVVGLAPSSSFYAGSFGEHSPYSTPNLQQASSPSRPSQETRDSVPLLPLPPLDFPEVSCRQSSSGLPSDQSARSPSALSPPSSLPNYNPLALFDNSPPHHSLLSLSENRSSQSILDKSSSTSEDDGALTESTSISGFTPPSKQSQFELVPPLPSLDSHLSASSQSYRPLPIDTTPPRSAPVLPTENLRPPLQLSSHPRREETSIARLKVTPFKGPSLDCVTSNGLSDPAGSSRLEHSPRASGLPLSEASLASPSSPSRPFRDPVAFITATPTLSSPAHISPTSSPRQLRASENSSITPTRAAALAAAREREKKVLLATASASRQGEAIEETRSGRNFGEDEDSARPSESQSASEDRPRSRMEVAFKDVTRPLLKIMLPFLEYRDVASLRQTSRTLKRSLETDGRELILERFLGGQGYRSLSDSNRDLFLLGDGLISLDLRDLSVFRAAQNLTLDDYSSFAKAYIAGNISPSRLRLARATTRAHNRVVLRLRIQTILPPSSFDPPSFPDLRQVKQPAYKAPRAPQLRAWVPTVKGQSWMTDQEVIECERELFRSGKGVWAQLKKGDVVYNTAIEAFGNCGRLLFDGRYLRDLAFEFDVVGHVPSWLNMLTLSPSHYHNILASSTSNPVFYLSLSPYAQSLQETLNLAIEKVSLTSPQGNYYVKKHVYRGVFEIQAGRVLELPNAEISLGGFETVHPDWAGKVFVVTEGTSEHAALLIARVASKQPTPWRILREKCRPGRLVISPVLEK
ncbi:hypothetical protein JCM3765_007293 [Sporobolomyces pararoseus]